MLTGTMATAKATATGRSGRADSAGARSGRETPAEGRKKSKLTSAGEEASQLARRTLLLTTCQTLGWDLAKVATALDLTTGADVIRALKELAPGEYEAARAAGDIRRGRRPEE